MALQVVIIFVGNSPFHIVSSGLTGTQWGICIGFSAITFVVSIITKFIPVDRLIDNYLDKKAREEELEEEKREENEDASQSRLNVEKFDIASRKMTRHLSVRSNKKSGKGSDSRGISSNQGVNIYNLKSQN